MNYGESTKLREVELKHERVYSYPTRENCADLDLSLYTATNELETSTSTEAHTTLAKHWLKRLEVHFAMPDISTFLAYDLHRCLEQCAVQGVLPAVFKDRDLTNLLACGCLLSVATHVAGDRSKIDANIGVFVSHWPVSSASHQSVDSMQTAVDFFYGKHVWDLCSADGSNYEEMIRTIWAMRLPTTNIQSTTLPLLNETQTIPNDFS